MFTTLISSFPIVFKLATSTCVPYMYPTIICKCVIFLKIPVNLLDNFLISMVQVFEKKQLERGVVF